RESVAGLVCISRRTAHSPVSQTSRTRTSLRRVEQDREAILQNPMINKEMAEREGFEPSVPVYPVQRFSKPSLSTTQPSLQKKKPINWRGKWCAIEVSNL